MLLLYVTKAWLSSSECFSEYRSAYYAGKHIIPLFVSVHPSDLSSEAATRFSTLCSSVQGIQIEAIPLSQMSHDLLRGSLDLHSKNIVWEKRRRVLRRATLSILALFTCLGLLAVYYKDYVLREFEQWQISSSFQKLSDEELSRMADKAGQSGSGDRMFRECDSSLICPDMLIVPGGDFWMGAADDFAANDWELPRSKITIEPFAVAKFEITRAQWSACHSITQLSEAGKCKEIPTSKNTGNLPADSVSWTDAKIYVAWLNEQTVGTPAGPYRLLSEAGWEYANRGIRSAQAEHKLYHWGNEIDTACTYANGLNKSMPDAFDIRREGLDCPNNPVLANEVGKLKPNAFGIHDMAGNLAEWVEDCWHDTYDNRPTGNEAWLTHAGGTCDRVIRGGSWYGSVDNLRAAARAKVAPGLFGFNIGFRVARDLRWKPPGE